MDSANIVIRGAREHNLQNIHLELPRNQLIVFTGVSGSGKSSLAFDTLYAEGQRRYVESLSSYARQFLGQLQKPDVDYLGGLSPSISIQQKTAGKNPRSTVARLPRSTIICVSCMPASAWATARCATAPSPPNRASRS
jgi:excinuclease ABC subunit A